MSVVDLHPEELIDKLAVGSLSAAESARLEAHVATCAACRFDLDLRHDFASVGAELPPRALLAPPAPSVGPLALPALRAARRGSRRPVWMLALAAALFAGGSLAALALRVLPARGVDPAPGVAESRAPGVSPGARGRSPSALGGEGGPAAVATQASVALEQLPLAAVVPTPGPRPSELRAAKAGAAPSDLFLTANAARRRGDSVRAIALYRTLEAEYPRSEEARLSYATLGRLLLDRGDARSALDGFDAYLARGGGGLGEEALVGRALALQKLGGRDGEITAWQEVLRRYPKSIHARLARSRLGALGER